MTTHTHRSTVPKLLGADIELGNSIVGLDLAGGTGPEAARALLRQVEGQPHLRTGLVAVSSPLSPGVGGAIAGVPLAGGYHAQDWGRTFLASNGGCVYIDLNHLELCTPEVLSARDHAACWHAMLRIARAAQIAATGQLPSGQSVRVMVNNSDGLSHAYGSHLNVLVTRRTWNHLFCRKLHYMLYLAAYQASSIIFTGQGKVGSENGAPPTDFQLSQRADFFETLTGAQTTYRRPLVNSRDESLCGGRSAAGGPRDDLARLHVIFYDNTLCQVATFLKVGVLQVILAMIEAECVTPNLVLEDPVAAVQRWSHDPELRARARLLSGQEVTALELQWSFLEEARRFTARGGCDGVVPEAEEVLTQWEGILALLEQRDILALAQRVDWALKLVLLDRVIHERPAMGWESPQVKHLDQLYGSLDPQEGLYWAYERSGFVERIVPEERVEFFVHNPPEDTRAWARAMLLRLAAGAVDQVNWDYLCFASAASEGFSFLEMADPLAFTRAEVAPVLASETALPRVLQALGASPQAPWAARKALKPAGNDPGWGALAVLPTGSTSPPSSN